MLSMPRRLARRRGRRPGGEVEVVRAGAVLFGREAGGDGAASLGRGEVPGEGQYVAPVAVLVEQGADLFWIAGCEGLFEVREPASGGAPGLLRGLVGEEVVVDVVRPGRLRAASIVGDAVVGSMDGRLDGCPCGHPLATRPGGYLGGVAILSKRPDHTVVQGPSSPSREA